MTILVTGGTGYIGSHTALKLIEAGYDIVIVDNFSNSKRNVLEKLELLANRNILFHETDIRNEEELEGIFNSYQIKAVIHFAGLKAVGESVKYPLEYYDNNINGTLTLCKVMEKYAVHKMVFSSSATVYGIPEQVPIPEDVSLHSTNPYGRTKLMIEEILRDLYVANDKWSIALLRYFNPTGAHESGLLGEDPTGEPTNLMPYIIQVADGTRDKLFVYGDDYDTFDGTGVRDYIHVEDLAVAHIKAIEKTMECTGVDAYNLGTGRGYSVLEVIEEFEKVNKVTIPYAITQRRSGDVGSCFADSLKAERELDWRAQKTLADMCKDSFNWKLKNSRRKLNIIHINTNDFRGGAAKVMSRLVQEQIQLGNDSKILVGEKESGNEDVFTFDKKLYHQLRNISENTGYVDYDVLGAFKLYQNPLIQNADVIHLHNLHGNYFHPYALSLLSQIKPIVWTLHDMQSITGHCSHAHDCRKWKDGCGNCTYMDEYPKITVDRTHLNWEEKKDIYSHSNLFIVPASEWLGDMAIEGLLSNQPQQVILNGVDIKTYYPKKKDFLRDKYGIPNNRIILGSVANGGLVGRDSKGDKYVQAVVNRLIVEGYDVLLVNVGGDKKGYENDYLYHVGYISSEEEMAEIYNTFDIYLYPSLADTCPLVISEAMACGVPIVTFATGGIPELVQHGETGYVSPFKDVDALYEYTKHLVTSPFLREEFSKKARAYCVDHFDHRLITQQYLDVYEKAIEHFENNKNQVLYFNQEKVPKIVRNTEGFQTAEKIKRTGFTKTLVKQQKIIIVSNRQEHYSNEYVTISLKEALLNGVENADIVFIDREKYKMSDSYFTTMLYKGISTDILMSSVVLRKQNGKSFFKSASSILKAEELGFVVDTSYGGLLYKSSFFNEHRQAILNGEIVHCSSKEEFITELVSVTMNDYINSNLHQSVYIYGAGTHTRELLEECPSLKSCVIAIIDSNASLHGTKLMDQYEIISVSEINREIPIIISSASFEHDIYEQLTREVNNPLITIYN